MTEYARHIEEYSSHYKWSHFSELIPENQWGDKGLAEVYLRKFWLSEQEYLDTWKTIQEGIFRIDKGIYVGDKWFPSPSLLPDLVFAQGFEMIAQPGGCLFCKKDFEQLQKAMQEVEEEYFVVIQRSQDYTYGEPMFRMKFPVNIDWEELTSGNYISAVLLEMGFNEYFVFGKSGNWGKYVATDSLYSLDIIGFKPELSAIFEEQFSPFERKADELFQEMRKERAYMAVVLAEPHRDTVEQ